MCECVKVIQKKKKKLNFWEVNRIVEEIKKIQGMLILKFLNDFKIHLYNIMIISMMEKNKTYINKINLKNRWNF